MAASLRWVLQLHKDVPKAAKLYSDGLGFTVNVCTLRWAELELQPGPLKLALMQSPTATKSPNRSLYSTNFMMPVFDNAVGLKSLLHAIIIPSWTIYIVLVKIFSSFTLLMSGWLWFEIFFHYC